MMDEPTIPSPLPTTNDSLTLDPSDPLNLLINAQHLTGEDDDQSMHVSQPDWSDISAALWAANANMESGDDTKPQPVDFDFSNFPLDFDPFDPSMAIDPTTLHLGTDTGALSPDVFTAAFPLVKTPGDVSNTMPFTFPQFPVTPTHEAPAKRRLSVTSSSSSSGASLSPVMGHSSASSASSQYGDVTSSPSIPTATTAEELAALIGQLAGAQAQMQAGWNGIAQAAQTKLPIPRLRPQTALGTSPATSSSTRSSSPQASSSSTASPPNGTVASVPAPTRQKTDHTTIERRYRTNLNVRIQSLKNAVPALRVLERKETDTPDTDVVDARGFVDGVKVARKVSKANVLGKAVEYIRVLKKREARLRREQDALKQLFCVALPGGPQILEAWEREWRANNGGEERDEVEGEEAEILSDEDEDGEDEDGEGGRARKKPKLSKAGTAPKPTQPKKRVAPAATPVSIPTDPTAPEKRKRGRPRKNLTALDLSGPPPPPIMAAPDAPQSQQAPQYLLAAFAFFSFFNSPLTAPRPSAHPHAHHGAVLTHEHPLTYTTPVQAQGITLHDVVQVLHLFVSLAVFVSIVVPWLPSALQRTRLASYAQRAFPLSKASKTDDAHIPRAPALDRSTSSASSSGDEGAGNDDTSARPKSARTQARAALSAALHPSARGTPDEAARLYAALGAKPGIIGMALQALWPGKPARYAGDRGLELRQLEQRAWVRIGELVALDESASVPVRMQAYLSMRARISPFNASPADLCTLALIVRPVARGRASRLWAQARVAPSARAHEAHVLSELDVHGGAARLRFIKLDTQSPLSALAHELVRARLRRHAAYLFLGAVDADAAAAVGGFHDAATEEGAREVTLEAGIAMGGGMRVVTERFARVWRGLPSGSSFGGDDEEDDLGVLDVYDAAPDVRALLNALVLFRRLFPSALVGREELSLPAVVVSPPDAGSKHLLALRRALDADVFCARDWEASEDVLLGEALEDARDRAVDALVERERMGVGRA